ncbi:MAG: MerR family transcriptional regulator [Lachnospiraceae bacterium]|nr:MerR family transcriptional regulator [Lachnospiraceae bacterium]
MDEKSKLLTIGQFAALHGINKKTLMWYDEMGLFQPAVVNPENGYRFYNYHQSAMLETILLLRELEVPISEIKKFMENRSARSMKELLDEQIEELDVNMRHLKAVRKTLCNYQENMDMLLHMDLSQICIISKKACSLVTVEISQDASYDKQVELITAETQKYQLRRLHDASYGTMISVESLYHGAYHDYSKLFIEIPFPIRQKGLHVQPSGRYVRAFYQGDWEAMPEKYEEIFAFGREHGLEFTGFSYEKIINSNVTDRMEEYIVQIEMPVLE